MQCKILFIPVADGASTMYFIFNFNFDTLELVMTDPDAAKQYFVTSVSWLPLEALSPNKKSPLFPGGSFYHLHPNISCISPL
jgi:hypothetical protein